MRKKENRVKTLEDILSILKTYQKELKDTLGITKIKIFGSYTENRQNKMSDLDIIVEFRELPGLIKLIKIEERLTNLLGVKVDLLTEEGISPYIREYIKDEKVLVL